MLNYLPPDGCYSVPSHSLVFILERQVFDLGLGKQYLKDKGYSDQEALEMLRLLSLEKTILAKEPEWFTQSWLGKAFIPHHPLFRGR